MDKAIAGTFQKIMGKGEKEAPLESIKLKVKFQKAKSNALRKKKGNKVIAYK